MPKGKIELKKGAGIHYDDIERHGDVYVYKQSYSHEVRAIPASDVENVAEGEWHQTPFGSCKSLSRSEVDGALKRHIGR